MSYWAQNTLCHSLDVIHIEKKCDNIIETLLDIFGKTIDRINTHYDLQEMGIRKNLHQREIGGGHVKFAKACFSMTMEEKSIFCRMWWLILYFSLDPSFSLCQKVIQVEGLDYIESQIIEIHCQLEMIFLPSFYGIMVHLPIHLANKVRLCGPFLYRWMYPTERYLCKSYVCNKVHLEAFIVEGYLAEEALTFCSGYLHKSVETRLNRKGQNDNDNGSCRVDSPDYLPNIG